MSRPSKPRRRLLFFFLGVFIVVVGVGSGVAAILNLPVWQIQHIEIRGTSLLDPALIRERIPVDEKDHLLLTRLRPIRKRLEKILQIESVSIRRRLPHTLVVTIAERKPFAVAKVAEESVVIDPEGIILTPLHSGSDESFYEQLPVMYPDLSGLPIVGKLPPEAVRNRFSLQKEYMTPVFTLFSRLSSFLPDRKFQLEMPSPHALALWIEDVLLVKLGRDEDLENKIMILETILRHVGESWKKVEYIDLRYPTHPVYKLRS